MLDVTASSSKDMTAVAVTLKKENTNEEQTDEKDNDEVQKKLVLPPEYDENDSKWTLKYREPAPGLVELMPHTGVYVNADKLAECQRLSTVCKRLARLLLTEVFTTSALSTCSWSGATANDSDIDGGQARPGLDVHARIILLKFVEEYGLLHNWILSDYQIIINHMRQIMLEMRRVGQKEQEDDDDEHQEKGSGSHMLQKMQKLRCDTQKEVEDYDGLLENGSYSYMRQTMLEMRRDGQKEEDYDELLEEDFHTRMYQIMLDIGRGRLQDSYDEVLKKGSHTRMFALPPEYDKNDSRWTFEYREPAPGRVELSEHSDVYVNADELDNCKKLNDESFQPRWGTFQPWTKRTCEKCIAAVCSFFLVCLVTNLVSEFYTVHGLSMGMGHALPHEM